MHWSKALAETLNKRIDDMKIKDLIKHIDELIEEWESSKWDNYSFVIKDLKQIKQIIESSEFKQED